MVNWTSSYLFDTDTDPDDELNEDEAIGSISKLNALYSQAKAGLGGGGKVLLRIFAGDLVFTFPCSVVLLWFLRQPWTLSKLRRSLKALL